MKTVAAGTISIQFVGSAGLLRKSGYERQWACNHQEYLWFRHRDYKCVQTTYLYYVCPQVKVGRMAWPHWLRILESTIIFVFSVVNPTMSKSKFHLY